jgi:hypothetical protein
MHFDDYPEDEIDETEVTVLQAVGGHRRFSYEYDFGDSWVHSVVVEEVTRLPRGLKLAVCIDGQNACPPEDCAGERVGTPSCWRSWPIRATGNTTVPFSGSAAPSIPRRSISSPRTWPSSRSSDRLVGSTFR